MARAIVEIKGLKEFRALCKYVGDTALPKHVRQANLDTAKFVADLVRAAAPRGSSATRDKHPGLLAASTRPMATQTTARVQIGRGLVYAKPIIFGWRRHHISPHPYPDRVLASVSGELPDRYQAAVAAAIQEGKSA